MQRVTTGVLKNGFRFYAHINPRDHVSGVGVRAGSVHDPPEKSGLCHLAEHMVAHFSREEELVWETYAGEDNTNIRVDRTSTFYGHDDLFKRDYMWELFDIVAKHLRHPALERVHLVRTEQAAVRNEYLEHGKDNITDTLETLLHEEMYEKNPVRNRIDCEEESLKRITVHDVTEFVKKYYVANNMFAIVLGPSFQEVKKSAERKFSDFPARPVPQLPYEHTESLPVLPGVKSVERAWPDIHQWHSAIAFPIPPLGSRDDEVFAVLGRILKFRVIDGIRRQNYEWDGGAYHPRVELFRSHLHGMLAVMCATPTEESARLCEEKIIAECESLRAQWVQEKELVAMRTALHDAYIGAFQEYSSVLAEMIIEATTSGDEELQRLTSYLGRLARVGMKSIRRVANEYLTPDRYLRIIIKPA